MRSQTSYDLIHKLQKHSNHIMTDTNTAEKIHSMEKIIALCKRRGFIFPSSQIYGGLQGAYDYGPMGVELKRNLQNTWWQDMVYQRDDLYGLDSSILTHQKTMEHSGIDPPFLPPPSRPLQRDTNKIK